MTSLKVTTIALNVGRTFKQMLLNDISAGYINIDINIDIPESMSTASFYIFDELIHVLEQSYRLDFYDENTNGWYSIPRNKGFRHISQSQIVNQKNSQNRNVKRNRKRQKRINDNNSDKNTLPIPIDEGNIMDRLRLSKKLRIDVQRTMENPVPIHSIDFTTSMFKINASNDIENRLLYEKRN